MQFDDVVGYHLLIGVWTGEFIEKKRPNSIGMQTCNNDDVSCM